MKWYDFIFGICCIAILTIAGILAGGFHEKDIENNISKITPEGAVYTSYIQLYELSKLDENEGYELSLLTNKELSQLKPEIFWVWGTLEELTKSLHINPKTNDYYHVFIRLPKTNQTNK